MIESLLSNNMTNDFKFIMGINPCDKLWIVDSMPL